MKIPVILRPEAETDIQEIYDALEQAGTGIGRRFIARLRDTLERIEAMPEIYAVIWQDVRAARLRKFRYMIYYIVCADRVEVSAVLHSSRDERTWQSRA
ncbi:MAG TPA: type II toxin-antitoxin system RelE/ParE family toxin [Gemmataceae bacterium]|nr:type II toxin-antitoxin system RelE/ParE family toxin [Gemmataceae bacterium]